MEMPMSSGIATKHKVSKENDRSEEAGCPHFSGRKLIICLSNLAKLTQLLILTVVLYAEGQIKVL